MGSYEKTNGILLLRKYLNLPSVKVIVIKIAYEIIKNIKNDHFLMAHYRKVVRENFSVSSGIPNWSKACLGQSGLSIAPTLDRFGRVQVKNDTIEKRRRAGSQFPPPKKKKK